MGRYIITNGEEYIGVSKKGGLIKVKNICSARVFSSKDKCKNVINVNLVQEREHWNFIKICDNKDDADINWENRQVVIQPNKSIKRTVMDDYIDKLKDMLDDVELKYLNLKRDLDIVEKEIVDIYHAIEFYDLSASKGYEIYKMLQDRLKYRRDIKNELEKIKIILGINIQKQSIEEAKEKMNLLENRSYVPRVMIELFD